MSHDTERALFVAAATVGCLLSGFIFAACDVDGVDHYNAYGQCAKFCEILAECEPETFDHFFSDMGECASGCEDNGADHVTRCMIGCATEEKCVDLRSCLEDC